MKLVDIDLDFVEVVGCGLGDAVGAIKARVLEARTTKLAGKEAGNLTFFFAGAEPPDDEDAILRGKPANPVKSLRAIVGDAATEVFFPVKVAGGGGSATPSQPSSLRAGAYQLRSAHAFDKLVHLLVPAFTHPRIPPFHPRFLPSSHPRRRRGHGRRFRPARRRPTQLLWSAAHGDAIGGRHPAPA